MWQTETVESSNTYREFLTSIVACATSYHVSAVAVNAAGSGHAVGDVITITHNSAYHPLRLEVTGETAGAIDTVRINTAGAFAERVASAVVGDAAGSGYAVGDILEVQDGVGASTCKAKFEVATLAGSAVATVTLFEDGGAYTTTPTIDEAATVGIGPAGFAGDDACTLDLTMEPLITPLTGVAQSSTTGTGINATFDLTLTHSGWAAQHNKNELTTNGVDDEKEVVLLGTVTSGDAPYIGFQSYTQTSGAETRYGIACFGMTAFNSALALSAQPGIGPLAWALGSTSGSHILCTEEVAEGNLWWISVTGRRICGCIRGNISGESDSYHTFYVGLGNQFGPVTTSPYPMIVAASSNEANRRTSDSDSTGLSEALQNPSGGGPIYYMRKSDLNWVTVRNAIAPSTVKQEEIMWPMGTMGEAAGVDLLVEDDNYKRLADGTVGSNIRANVANHIYPAPGANDEYPLLPLTIISWGGSSTNSVDTTIVAELDGVFWTGGTTDAGASFTSEDYISNSSTGKRYRAFPSSTASLSSRRYLFMVMRED